MKIDAHQHFWHFDEQEYDWIGEEDTVLRRDFLPDELAQLLASQGIDKSIAVQARQSSQETQWLLDLAKQHSVIAGVVGWIDLKATDLAHQLKQFEAEDKLKGFRHVLQGELDENYMLAPEFIRGINTLAEHNYSYDLLIVAKQLPQTLALVKQLPPMRLVIDHIAKPDIKHHSDFEHWANYMRELAAFPNVYCKVSGMVTEADMSNWHADDFLQYLDVVFQAFGTNRIMFGSDWPVCLLAADYPNVKKLVSDYVALNHNSEQAKIFGENAVDFYQIKNNG